MVDSLSSQVAPRMEKQSQRMPQKQTHLDLLDYTRGVAILGVVAYHCLIALGAQLYWNTWVRDLNVPLPNLLALPLNLGYLGVAIFFVVSGFCIHLSFQQRGGKYADFYIRRFFRIYPAYLAAVLLFALWFPKTSLSFSGAAAQESWKQLISHLLLIHNFWPGTYAGINPSFWSLAVEVQLYLLYPVLLFLTARLGWKWTLILLGIIESAIHIAQPTVILNAILPGHPLNAAPSVITFLKSINDLSGTPLAYWFCWSLGAVLADYYMRHKPLPLANVSPMIWIGSIVLCFVFRPLSGFTFMMGCLLTTTLLSRRLRDGINIRPEALGWKFLSKIGVGSYSLYLLHQPILFATPTGWLSGYGMFAKLFFLGLVGLAILLPSWLCYIAIEVPGVKLGKILIKAFRPKTGPAVVES